MRSVEVTPVAGALGAIVSGIDLSEVTDVEQLEGLRKALADHLVVFLPEQEMDLDDLERITDLLGGRDTTPFVKPLEDRPYVIRVIKEPDDQLNFANAWHSDLSYLAEPPSYTLLHAYEVPQFGGDTIWSNQYMAYELLSRGLREALSGLRVVHSAGMAYGSGGFLDQVKDLTSMAIAPSPDAYREQSHPAVIEHPVTKRPALYVNPVYTTRIEGWSPVESEALLGHVYRHATNENLTCRFRWAPRTLAIWDNRCTMHNALNDYSGVRREMFRTSVKGSTPTRVHGSQLDITRTLTDSGSAGSAPLLAGVGAVQVPMSNDIAEPVGFVFSDR
ncbi:MAG TPA: TauD/TfdA family dioxygenase [Acidimicrobiales bacterium]|nr:TauD/TfdA family dioxygenase [Acidimicrobiales bacterium]